MKVTVYGKKIDIDEAFPALAEGHLEEAVDRYFEKGIDSSTAGSRVGSGLRVNISVAPGRGNLVPSSGEAETAHRTFDQLLEGIAKRLRDHHREERSAAKQNPVYMQRYVIAPPLDDEENAKDEVVVANTAETIGEKDTLPVSVAVMRMDLAARTAYVFRIFGNGRANMGYCRGYGNIERVEREVSGDAVRPAEGQRWKL